MSHRLALALGAVTLLLASLGAVSAAAADPAPFGHACLPQAGVRFCPTTDLASRVASFDGTPIDVDVTLPPTGDGPWPTILLLHGLGGTKESFESTDPSSGSGFNNVALALRGYAVVTPTARGYGNSCGTVASRTPNCATGWTRIDDQRYEIRDYQSLLGVLADEGVTQPTKIGTTGVSYGGGASTMLAYLKDRIRLPDGRYAPWTSPAGTPMAIAAAYPRWQWSNGASIFVRNGRGAWSNAPLGVVAGSYVAAIFGVPEAVGFVAPQGTADYSADLLDWHAALNAGVDDAATRKALANALAYHGVETTTGTPAPLLLESGWTDNLFPVGQSLAVYDQQLRANPKAPVQLQVADTGHARGTNRPADVDYLVKNGYAFLDHYLKGTGATPAPGKVTALTQTCPTTTAHGGGPYVAASWSGLARGSFTVGAPGSATVTSTGGDLALGKAVDPLSKTGGNACSSYKVVTSPHTAVLRRTSPGLTLLGLPVVRGTISTTATYAQLDARLWDVAPGGRHQTLITTGTYRPKKGQRGAFTWTLDGNGYRFAKGHLIRLEIVGRDAPTYSESPSAFSVGLKNLSVTLPTRDAPSRAKGIAKPAR